MCGVDIDMKRKADSTVARESGVTVLDVSETPRGTTVIHAETERGTKITYMAKKSPWRDSAGLRAR